MDGPGGYAIERMCRQAGVSRAGYYRHWQAHAPRCEAVALHDAVQRLCLAQRHYGHRRIAELLRRQGWVVSRKRVLRVMGQDNLLCVARRAFVPATTDARHDWQVWPNLARRLVVRATNQLWVADITYVRLGEAFVYLAVVLDAFSRRVVGWALADHLRAELAVAALEMALATRQVTAGALVHHSDRGVQYACDGYIGSLEAHGIVPSMSRAGCPYDNAMAESFMKTLKSEEVNGRAYRTMAEVRANIGSFIETVYNRDRLHSALDYLSPIEFEARLTPLGTAGPRGVSQSVTSSVP